MPEMRGSVEQAWDTRSSTGFADRRAAAALTPLTHPVPNHAPNPQQETGPMNATRTLVYYVTRFSINPAGRVTTRQYLTRVGTWTPDRRRGQLFATQGEAEAVRKLCPGSFVDTFPEDEPTD